MKISKLKIEKLKTNMIVVLIISAILLLYFLWKNQAFDNIDPIEFITENTSTEQTDPNTLVIPERMIITEAGRIKSADIYLDVFWAEFIEHFKAFSDGQNIYVEEIKKNQWDSALEYGSLIVRFPYDINFSSFCTLFSVKQASGYNIINSVREIAYSEAGKESIIVHDKANDKYYILFNSDKGNLFGQLMNKMDETLTDYYYQMGKVFGIKNPCLIPESRELDLYNLTYLKETQTGKEEKTNQIAESFFGESLDFIRKIKEYNNTTVFLYGYGEKVLTAYNNGQFEYREEQNSTAENQSMGDIISIAVDYVDKHGGFEQAKGSITKPYIQNIQAVEGKRKGYSILFCLKVNGIPVEYEQNQFIKVTIIGDQVTEYSRQIITPKIPTEADLDQNKIIAAADVILKNYAGSMTDVLRKNDIKLLPKAKAGEEEFKNLEDVANKITDVRITYLNSDTGKLTPVWTISFDKIQIYYDVNTGEYLKYAVK